MAVKDLIITDSAIDLAIEHLDNNDESELMEVFERLSHEQPDMMGFVVGLGEGMENARAEEDLLYLVMVIWHAVELAKSAPVVKVDSVRLEHLEALMDARYEEVLAYPDETEEEDLANLIASSSQPALIQFLANEFFSEEYIDLSEEQVVKLFAFTSVLAEELGSL
jgi:hypothetical protein